MSARTQVTALLAAKLPPGWNVIKRARVPETLPKPTLLVWGEKVTRMEGGPAKEWVLSDVVLWCLTPDAVVDSDQLEDVLDDQLTVLLDAIEATREFTWQTGERLALDGRWPGWKLTIQTALKITT